MVLGGGATGRWLSHEGGTLTNGISALIKETAESSLFPFSAMWGCSKKMAICERGSRPSPDNESANTSSWSSKPPELWEKISVVYKPSIQSMVSCYISLNELRQHPNSFYKANITFLPKPGKNGAPTKLQTNVAYKYWCNKA